MNSFLDQVFLGNPIRSYIVLAAVLLFVVLIKRLLSKGVALLLYRVIRHWAPGITQQEFNQLLLRPLEYFLVLVVFMVTVDHLRFPPELNIKVYNKYQLQQVTDTLLQLTLSMSVIWILLRLIDFIAMVLGKRADLTHDLTDNQFVVFFRDFFKAIALIFGAIAFIRILFGADLVNKIVAGLGIGAAALALAAKESIENLIGSFIIFFDKPFRVGDAVKVDAYQGTIEKIGLRSTRLRTLEKTFVTVPNKQMVDSILDNLTLRTQQRVALRLEVAGDTPADNLVQVLQDIRETLKGNKNVLEGFVVNLNDFTKDTYVIQVIYMTYIIEGAQYNNLRETVNLAIVRALEQRGVKLSSTKVEIHEK